MGLLTLRRGAVHAVFVTLSATALGALRVMPSAPLPPRPREDAPASGPAPATIHPTLPTEPLRAPAAHEDPRENDCGVVYPVALPVTSIGRALDNAIALLDPAVSRQHALLRLDDDGWRVENISERNPLWVGGVKVAGGERAPVTPGQIIQLGATRLQLLAPLTRPTRADATANQVTGLGGPSPFNVLSPGVTLQYALRGQVSRSAGWTLAALALVVFVASALLTLDVAALAGQAALASGGLRQALTAMAIPIAPALGVGLVVAALDRYEREPLLTLVGAFLWGAIIAIPPALYFEGALSAALAPLLGALSDMGARALAQAAAAALTAGGVEELVKGAGLLLLLLALRDEFDNVTDGVLYGALIGAGFAMVENIVYFATTPSSGLGYLIIGRIALGWLSHSTFTALFGAGLGYIRETRDQRARWLAPLGGLLGAIILHTYFDFVVYTGAFIQGNATDARFAAIAWLRLSLPALTTLIAYVPILLATLMLLQITLGAHRREAATVRAYLAAEMLSGVVTPDEYLLAQDAPMRSAVERDMGLRYGLRAYLLARALYQTETGLAFRKWHVEMGDPPKRADRQPEDAYRERIPRLRRALARATTSPPFQPNAFEE